MSEIIHLKGEGGAVWKMTLPLSRHIAERYEAGELKRVNPDGSPYEEPPAPKRPRAPKAAADGA